MRLRAAIGLGLSVAIALSGCTDDGPAAPAAEPTDGATSEPAAIPAATVRLPAGPAAVLDGTSDAALAIQASQAVFDRSPVVVLVAAGVDPAGAAAIAMELGVPALVTPADAPTTTTTSAQPPPTADASATTDELARLEASTVVAVGLGAQSFADGLPEGIAVLAAPDAADEVGDLPPEGRPEIAPTDPPGAFAALSVAGTDAVVASATLTAAGGESYELAVPDPRTDSDVIAALAAQQPTFVIGLGAAFGPPEQLAYRVGVAKTGVELPGGLQVLYPYHRNVALYGNPTSAALGSLGEQDVPASIDRVKTLAEQYQAFTEETVVPTFEVISSVASASPSSGGDYSTEMTADDIDDYVDAARDAGVYVVLDLQPGRTDFLTQAKLFEQFLKQPHVGLALDPEWRLKPGQVHLEQVGTVTAAEINSVVTWLADLTRDNNLPQKLLVLHQFKTMMISDRVQVDTTRDELAVLIHVDGFGPVPSKFSTWNTIRSDPPPNVWWGWKNFIDEDSPLMTPEATMAVDPVPQFVSYQ